LRHRVIGAPEISTDGLAFYRPAIWDAFGNRIAHGTITKTYSVTHLAVKETARRYSPTAVIAAERDAVNGMPEQITQATLSAQPLGLARTKPCARRRRLCSGLQIAFGRLA